MKVGHRLCPSAGDWEDDGACLLRTEYHTAVCRRAGEHAKLKRVTAGRGQRAIHTGRASGTGKTPPAARVAVNAT